MHYPAERGHFHHGKPLSWRSVSGVQQCLGRYSITCQIYIYVNARPRVSQQNIVQSTTLPPPTCLCPKVHTSAIASPGKRSTQTQPFTWGKSKWDSSIQETFFYCANIQFRCLRAYCRCFWQWAGVIIGALIGLRLRCDIPHIIIISRSSVGSDQMG